MPENRYYPQSVPPVKNSGRWRTVLHLVLALLGWVLFGAFWIRVFYRTPPSDSAVGVLVVGILLVVSVSLTVAWIRHNLVLSESFGDRRRQVREVPEDWSRDRLGRPVQGPAWETLRSSSQIEIDLAAGGEVGTKVYRAY